MTERVLIVSLYTLAAVAALATIATGIMGIWTGDDRWAWTSLVAFLTAFSATVVAVNL